MRQRTASSLCNELTWAMIFIIVWVGVGAFFVIDQISTEMNALDERISALEAK